MRSCAGDLCLEVHNADIYYLSMYDFLCFMMQRIEFSWNSFSTTTLFILFTTVHEAGQKHWYGKEGCTNHHYVASTPQTSGLCWLPSCHPQSCVLIFSALFLTIWSIRVTGTLCITDLSLYATLCVYVRVYMYRLFAKWAKSASVCGFGSRVHWFCQHLHFPASQEHFY